MTAVMQSHISNVMGHFKGKCYAWDVVNEALEDDGSYRNNPFLKALGDSYFALSFKFAAAADPGTKLYYNDCTLTITNLPTPEKRDRTYHRLN
jgi:endo-1,4-beta-xylanase